MITFNTFRTVERVSRLSLKCSSGPAEQAPCSVNSTVGVLVDSQTETGFETNFFFGGGGG